MTKHFIMLVSLLLLLCIDGMVSQAQQVPQNITDGAYQNYENGVMLWRADTEDIWVLYDTGEAESFPISLYDDLPDNPINDVPENRVLPVNGFGRIWGNFSSVRNNIGNPVSAEVAYTMVWELQSRGGVIKFSLLVNVPFTELRIAIHDIGRWDYHILEEPVCEDCQSIYIAYQEFQNGHMVYDFDTGTIYVATDSDTSSYAITSYGALSLDPVSDKPPYGLEKPILGFGKVWGHFPLVRQQLGWATAPEYAYRAPRTGNASDAISIALPDGKILNLIR